MKEKACSYRSELFLGNEWSVSRASSILLSDIYLNLVLKRVKF